MLKLAALFALNFAEQRTPRKTFLPMRQTSNGPNKKKHPLAVALQPWPAG
jgi:hypothetical protein